MCFWDVCLWCNAGAHSADMTSPSHERAADSPTIFLRVNTGGGQCGDANTVDGSGLAPARLVDLGDWRRWTALVVGLSGRLDHLAHLAHLDIAFDRV